MLRSVDASGTVVDHGALEGVGRNPGAHGPQLSGLAASSDGHRWTWSVQTWNPHGTATVASAVYVGGDRAPSRLLIHETTEGSSALMPLWWLTTKVVVVNMPLGVGGGAVCCTDMYWGNTRLLDPTTSISVVLSDGCALNDTTADGSWTCVGKPLHPGVAQSSPSTVVQVHPAGRPGYDVGFGRISGLGNAILDIRRERLAAVTSTNVVDPQDFKIDIVDLKTGTHHHVGSPGDAPASWLPDGTLILENVGRGGCKLLHPDGTTTRLGVGFFVGYLDPTGSIPTHVGIS